jgi:hypothetical protein
MNGEIVPKQFESLLGLPIIRTGFVLSPGGPAGIRFESWDDFNRRKNDERIVRFVNGDITLRAMTLGDFRKLVGEK